MSVGEGGGMRLQRSELAVPATSEHFFAKAAASAADVVFLDLEDAVAPSRKEQARAGAIRALTEIDWGRKTLALRINGLDTPWAHRDILEVVSAAPRLDLVLLPKAGSAFDVRFVEQLLVLIEREHHRSRQVGIEVLIETAKGVANVEEIAGASGRLEAMIFGIGDYTVDMQTFDTIYGTPSPRYSILTAKGGEGRERHWNDQWHFAMARIANACRANGLRPIDGPFTDFGDPEGYRASALRAAALGFEGKWAIHPTQIALANEAFTPSPEQIGWARKVEDAVRRANADGKGAIGMDGVLVDMAHARQADAMLRRAEAIMRQGAPI
jgi:malyl-CoA/(S)-citramalyl-CoA lyase